MRMSLNTPPTCPHPFGDISLKCLFKLTLLDYQIKDYKCFLFAVIITRVPPEEKSNPLKVPLATLVMLVSYKFLL